MRPAKANLGWRAYGAVFVITIAVTTLYHLLDEGVKVALLFDGRHYFESCQRMTGLILALVSMKADQVAAAEQSLREYIMLDGPVLPTLFGSVYALLGRIPTSADWTLIVWVQTVLHALATTLICKITFQMTRKHAVAFTCCALWALYPAALVASGRLMTESLAVVLLLSLPLALRGAISAPRTEEIQSADEATKTAANAGEEKDASSSKVTTRSILSKFASLAACNQFGFAAGIVSGLLILLKPGMIPSVALSWLACLAMTRARLAVVVSLLLGAGLSVSPWMLYTKQTTGKAAITVQRMPVHNALIGWDPETSGWQTNPPSGFERVMNTGGEPLSTIEGIWLSHPQDCINILVEKFGHLYSTPWNDYRANVFGVGTRPQGFYHCLLLFLGLGGVFAWILTSERKNKLAILCIAAATGQCVYLMFEPVCRYAFPQIAFAPVLSALFLALLPGNSKKWKTIALASILSAGCVELIAQSEKQSSKRLEEVAHALANNEKLAATIKFNPQSLPGSTIALLLVDGDANLESARVEVNGHKCFGNLIAFNYYDPQRYQAFNLLKELGYGMHVQVDDFRIWRAIPVPLNAIEDGVANITITAGQQGCTIYGDHQESRNYLSPDFLCVNRLINSKSSLEMRNESPIPAARTMRSWTFSDNPRIHLLLAKDANPAAEELKSSTPLKPSNLNIALSPADFDENMRTPTGEIKISRSILKAARSTGLVRKLPKLDSAANVQITLEGDMHSGPKPGELGIVISTVTDKNTECFLARLPSSIPTKSDWTHFKLTDITPCKTRQGEVNAISIAFFPGPWQQIAGYGADKKCTDTLIRNLRLSVRNVTVPSLADKQLVFF